MLSSDPIDLVIALYDGAIEACRRAENCLESGDILGRSKAITKAVKILTELLVNLNHEKGGDISANLQRLYSYMQSRLLEAHTQQKREPIAEVERLLSNLLDGWHGVVREKNAQAVSEQAGARSSDEPGHGYCEDRYCLPEMDETPALAFSF